MLKAYWIPTAIFYILPSIWLLIAAKELHNLGTVLFWIVPVPCALFGVGALVAPYFGPRILEKKHLSIVMAMICQLSAILLFITSQWIVSERIPSFFYFLISLPIFFLYSLLPTMLGAVFFARNCTLLKNTKH